MVATFLTLFRSILEYILALFLAADDCIFPLSMGSTTYTSEIELHSRLADLRYIKTRYTLARPDNAKPDALKTSTPLTRAEVKNRFDLNFDRTTLRDRALPARRQAPRHGAMELRPYPKQILERMPETDMDFDIQNRSKIRKSGEFLLVISMYGF